MRALCDSMMLRFASLQNAATQVGSGSSASFRASASNVHFSPESNRIAALRRTTRWARRRLSTPQMTIKEATKGGPLAQPAAFRVVTSARRPRSRRRGSWRIYCQRRPQAAPLCRRRPCPAQLPKPYTVDQLLMSLSAHFGIGSQSDRN